VSIALGNGDGSLWFEVSDDGAGFDPATAAESPGFVNMRDRLGAVGGELAVTAAPGSGTSIRGTVPVAVCDAPDS
jgi:signal transduction histidine kinase